MSKAFQRKIENFICENCGLPVKGNGYTNHCPFCLYSKHVDVHPGDREESCRGLMRPVGLELKSCEKVLVQKCVMCGDVRRCKVAPEDNPELLLLLSQSPFA